MVCSTPLGVLVARNVAPVVVICHALTTTHEQHMKRAAGHGVDHVHRHGARLEPRWVVVHRGSRIAGFGRHDSYYTIEVTRALPGARRSQ